VPIASPLRVLALVSRFKWLHIDYLHALAGVTDLSVGWSGIVHEGSVDTAVREGLRLEALGDVHGAQREQVRGRLAALLEAVQPDLVHVMHNRHEELVLLARELVGDHTPIVCEIRDPRTTLERAFPGSPAWELEASALAASDGRLFVSRALREYLEDAHRLDFAATSLVVPHAFARRNAAPPAEKLSVRDGRVHLALVGTADDEPGYGRWYGDIIRRLVAQGLVVHSRFHHEIPGISLDAYRALDKELRDYHFDDKAPFRRGTLLSDATSQYDLMGVFHELEAEQHNEPLTLRVCLPTKAVCGWFHGAIPVVCTHHYGGVVELIEEHGIGFTVDTVDDVAAVAADRRASEQATAAVAAVRDWFTNERQAVRVEAFYRAVAARARGQPVR
jgi:glycosyltransferase involved in cell wall biosynthesis